MPTPRRYANRAQQQAAYRKRQAQARAQEMLAKGLPPLPAIPTLPGWRRWEAMAQQVCAMLETLQAEMQSYAEDRSEEWQESDRGDDFKERIQAVEQALQAAEALSE